MHLEGLQDSVMPARTSEWPDAIDVHAWHAMVVRSFSANAQTPRQPESTPDKNEPAPRFFPPTKVVRAHRGLHNNLATMPQGTPARAHVRSPKSARVYSSKA